MSEKPAVVASQPPKVHHAVGALVAIALAMRGTDAMAAEVFGAPRALRAEQSEQAERVEPPTFPMPEHRVTKSGLFDTDVSIADDLERAEVYLGRSDSARRLFDRLKGDDPPIRVEYKKNADRQVGFGKDARIVWDSKAYLEAHDGGEIHPPGSCSINSAALIFLHEAHHADWARRNQIGQYLLMHLPHPLYDDLEEARVVLETNGAASELHESLRGSHRGRLHPAQHVLDRNDGECVEKSLLSSKPELATTLEIRDAIATRRLRIPEAGRKQVQTALDTMDSPADAGLVNETLNLLTEHDDIGDSLNDGETAEMSAESLANRVYNAYARQIELAIQVATKFMGLE